MCGLLHKVMFMKRIFLILLIATLLAGCTTNAPKDAAQPEIPSQAPSTESTIQIHTETYTVYIPNENADGWNTEEITVNDISPDAILLELQRRDIISSEVSINQFQVDGDQINIDFNPPFADQICSTGTAGEYMIMGSIVNTFLNAFQAESIFITVEGEILESGHVIYDFPMTYME